MWIKVFGASLFLAKVVKKVFSCKKSLVFICFLTEKLCQFEKM